ncbi:unnamed protein product, partial [Closterium sp. Naga37s-1]
ANVQRRNTKLKGVQQPMDLGTRGTKLFIINPMYPCPFEERLGDWGDGGKWTCMIPGVFQRTTTVYSIGSRGSYDFEEDFARAHAGAIFTFDPFLKPAVEEQMRDLPFLHFRAIGLSGEADLQTYRRKNPTKLFVTLPRMLALMNHTYVDVFKIDCEGCELEVIKDMTASYGSEPAKLAIHGGALPFGQILMEFHHLHKPALLLPALYALENLGGQQELQDGGQQLPHGGGQVQLQRGGTARAASVGAVSGADEEGTSAVGERAAVVAEVADGAATAAPDGVATEVRDRALARSPGTVEATAGAEESAAGAAETADGVARAAGEAGSNGDAAVPPQPHDEVLPAPPRPTPMQSGALIEGQEETARTGNPETAPIHTPHLLTHSPPGAPTLCPHSYRHSRELSLLPAPSAQPAPGDPHMGSSPSNPPPDKPSPLQAHGGGFTGAILPHKHLVATQDDALPTRMEVVGVGVDRMTAQLRGLEGELRPVRQPHATQPHGPAVLQFSLAGPDHPPSLTDLEASEPSSGLGAAVSDLLAIRNTGIPLPTPTHPAPVVHAHEAPLMDPPLAAPILHKPFHPSPMETDLIFRPCASDADVGAPLLPASPHPSPSPAPPITTADSSEGTATADPTDTATSGREDPEAPGPTLLLAAAATLLLAPATPPERSNTAAIAARIIRFGRGELDELISEALHRRTPLPLRAVRHARATTFSPTPDDRRIARCLRMAACNETSRACAAVESAEAAPDTEIQPHKCLVYGRDFVTSKEVEAFTSLKIEVARRGLIVTGVPVGSDAFVERSLPERLERMGRVLPWLPRLRQPQTVARLLSACVSTRPQYLARTVPPTPAVRAIFARWDERLGETFQQLLVPGTWTCREDVREAALDQIYLPIRLGGLGIRRMERIAPVRYACSWVQCAPILCSLPVCGASFRQSFASDDVDQIDRSLRTALEGLPRDILSLFPPWKSCVSAAPDSLFTGQQGGLGRGAGGQEGREGQDGLASGGEEGGQQQQRQQQQQQQLGQQGQEGQTRRGEERGQHGQQQRGQQGQEGLASGGEESGQQQQQQQQSQRQQQQRQQQQPGQQGQRQQVCRGEERGQQRQHQEAGAAWLGGGEETATAATTAGGPAGAGGAGQYGRGERTARAAARGSAGAAARRSTGAIAGGLTGPGY